MDVDEAGIPTPTNEWMEAAQRAVDTDGILENGSAKRQKVCNSCNTLTALHLQTLHKNALKRRESLKRVRVRVARSYAKKKNEKGHPKGLLRLTSELSWRAMRPFGIAAAQRRLIVAACASHSALATSLIVATRPYVALAAAGPWSEATGASSPLRNIASARSVSASAADRSPGCAGLPMVRLGCSVCRRHSGDSMGGIELVLVSQRGIRTLCIGRLTLLTGRLTAVAVVGASRALVAPPSSCDVLQAAGWPAEAEGWTG